MSNYKSSKKGELVAIYRLEFYKNQKKWKFCKNEKKMKKQVPSKQKLNETYQVEAEEPALAPAPLNDAFLETDSDENVKEAPAPVRRRWSTILDLKIEPETIENEDWAIEEEPVVRGGWLSPPSPAPAPYPAPERLRSYEEQWEGGGGAGEAPGWPAVEQVYTSELYVSNGQSSRLPVFASWPAPDQHTAPADSNILQNMLQNSGQKTGRRNVAETLKQHIQNFTQNVGRTGPNLHTYMNQSEGRNLYDYTQIDPHLRQNLTHNLDQVYPYEQNLKQMQQTVGQDIKQFVQNIGQIGQNVGNLGQNMASFGQNGGNLGQNMGSFGQNCGYVGKDIDSFGQNIVKDMEQCDELLECDPMEWEERGVLAVMAGAGAEWGEGGAAEGWPLAHLYLEGAAASRDASLSSGDSAAFMRGAHARAHSSEVDLVIETPCQCSGMSSRELARTPSSALLAALRAHASAAQRVLRELRARQRTRDAQPCPGPMSHDATHSSVPTRDVPARDVTAARDVLGRDVTARDVLARDVTAARGVLARDVTDVPAPGRGRGRRLLTK